MSIYSLIDEIRNKIVENKEFLTDLDREIGDADHGANMARGFNAVMEKLPKDNKDIGDMLNKTGMTLLSSVGGASGPLYGTVFMNMGKVAKGKEELDLDVLVEMFNEAIEGVKKRGKAEKGEKTMLDSLIPAYEALKKSQENGDDIIKAVNKSYEAALEGVEFTKTIKATKGRASYLGERSIDHQDPGATSTTLMIEVLKDYFENK